MRCRDGGLREFAPLKPSFRKLGHAVKLVPPIYVKPFVKQQKNDAADAEAICEGFTRDDALRGGETKASRLRACCSARATCWFAIARKR